MDIYWKGAKGRFTKSRLWAYGGKREESAE